MHLAYCDNVRFTKRNPVESTEKKQREMNSGKMPALLIKPTHISNVLQQTLTNSVQHGRYRFC